MTSGSEAQTLVCAEVTSLGVQLNDSKTTMIRFFKGFKITVGIPFLSLPRIRIKQLVNRIFKRFECVLVPNIL